MHRVAGRSDECLLDTELAAECQPRARADGSIACFPPGIGAQSLFSDATCQTPIDVARIFRGNATCGEPPVPAFSVSSTLAGCSEDITLRRMGPEYAGTVYSLAGSTCIALDSSRSVTHRLLDVLPNTDLATGVLVTDE